MWIVSLTQRTLSMFQILLSFQSQPISLELTGMRKHSSFAFRLCVLDAQMITDTNKVFGVCVISEAETICVLVH